MKEKNTAIFILYQTKIIGQHTAQCCGPGPWLDPASENEADPTLIYVFLEQTFKGSVK
jgi:hypothetical protein